jgi:hypothetical protein
MVKRLKTEGEVYSQKNLLAKAIAAEKELNKLNGVVDLIAKRHRQHRPCSHHA